MAQLHKSAVTLRISGDDLIPDEITSQLGASPTHAWMKGDKIVDQKTGHVRVAKRGMWQLRASDREPEDMDGQIQEILSGTTGDLAVWRSISKKYLFCGLFMRAGNEGLTISSHSLAALEARGIQLGLDIDGGDYDKEKEETGR